MVGKQGGNYHRKLSASENQRIEIGIEFTSDIVGTENELDTSDNPEHNESFQKSDDETEGNEQVDVSLTGTYPAQKQLESQVGQQK